MIPLSHRFAAVSSDATTGAGIAPDPLQPRHVIRTLQPSLIRQVANSAMGRDNVLPFWFGESDETTPEFIRDAAVRSLQQGETFYTQNLGRPWLREAIAGYMSQQHQRPFSAEQIGVTSSGVSALMLAMQLLLSPGDKVVAVTPIWPNLVEIPRILGAEVIREPLINRDNRWQLNLPHLLEQLDSRVRLLLLNSPNNPTGWTISAEEQQILLAHCRRHGIWILADDVYSRLVYRGELGHAPSFLDIAQADDRLISVNSFSKAWCMTGWRAGWLTLPESLSPYLATLVEYNTSCVPDFVQRAAFAAITQGESFVASQRVLLAHRRRLLTDTLRQLPGIRLPDADGAMYAFFSIEGHQDSVALATELIEKVGLGLAPGAAFGPEGEGWLRWCYATSADRLAEGIERLERFLRR